MEKVSVVLLVSLHSASFDEFLLSFEIRIRLEKTRQIVASVILIQYNVKEKHSTSLSFDEFFRHAFKCEILENYHCALL